MNGPRIASLQTLSSKAIAKSRPLNYLKNIELYQHVLPWVSKPACFKFLKEKGPAFWKLLDIVSDAKKHEATQLSVLTEPTFVLHLPVYFQLWNEDVKHLPVHIYELGFGRGLQQCVPSCQLWYLQSLNPSDREKNPVLVLPLLAHVHEYYEVHEDHITVVHGDNRGPEYNIAGKSQQELYFIKLFCAEACMKQERWSESFAHALSALDLYQDTFPHLHNLYCQLALAAGKMVRNPDIWIQLLHSAQQKDKYIYHKWRRIVTFHQLLVHHGLFDLERTVFAYGEKCIPSNSGLHMMLLTQHVNALMAQVENIAGFQYVRQTFHEFCNPRTCGKPALVQYSFSYSAMLIREMEKIIPLLWDEAHRHYFQGYVYLYKSFGPPLDSPTEKDTTYLEMAKSSFDLALLGFENTASTSAMLKDLRFVRAGLKKLDVDDDAIIDSYSAMTNMKYNIGSGQTCFRMMLLFYYWGYTSASAPPASFAYSAYKLYRITAECSGYRAKLMLDCQETLEQHDEHDSDLDFPRVSVMSVSNNDLKEKVKNYWATETGQLPMGDAVLAKTSEQLLSNNVECQELYAFGAAVINSLIE